MRELRTFGKPKRLRRGGTLSKFYYARVYDGVRRTWKCTQQDTAGRAKEVVETWKNREAQGERFVEDLSFEDAANRWLKEKTESSEPVSHKCGIVYRSYVKHWVAQWHKTPLRRVSREDVALYVKRRLARVTPCTVNNERRVLRGFFIWASAQGLIRLDPSKLVKKVKTPARQQIRFLTEEESEAFLKECEAGGEDLYGFVLCLLRSGLRHGTVSRLEWPHVNFTKGEWRIPSTLMKSGADFVGRPIEAELLAYLRERRRPAGKIFRPLRREAFRAAAKAAGFEWLKPHDCRRSFVSRCRRQNVPMEVAMWLSDHRDIGVVVNLYRGVDSREGRKWIDRAFGTGKPEAQPEIQGTM